MTPWTREEAQVLLDEVEREWREMPEEQRRRIIERLSPEAQAEIKRRHEIRVSSHPALRDD